MDILTKETTLKRLILFDIDDTLTNTPLLKVLQAQRLAEASKLSVVEIEELSEVYRNTLKKNTDFQPNELLQFIATQKNISLELLQKTFWDPTNFQKVLFPEVREVFKTLSEKYTLGTFSEGFEKYQKHKLEANNLLPFFDPNRIYLLRRKMDPEVIKTLPEKTVIIDDRSDVIEFLKQFENIQPFHIVRNAEEETSQTNENFSKTQKISSLRDLLTLL